MPDYDNVLFTPPAPVALVTLRNSDSGATQINVSMLLDTGADVSLIPQARYRLTCFDNSCGHTIRTGRI